MYDLFICSILNISLFHLKHCFTFRLQNVSALITLQSVNSVRTEYARRLNVQGIHLTVVGRMEQMNTYYMKKVLFFYFYFTPYLLCLCQVRTLFPTPYDLVFYMFNALS